MYLCITCVLLGGGEWSALCPRRKNLWYWLLSCFVKVFTVLDGCVELWNKWLIRKEGRLEQFLIENLLWFWWLSVGKFEIWGYHSIVLRIQVFWDVTLCYWVVSFELLKECSTFIFKGQAVQEDHTFPLELLRWGHGIPSTHWEPLTWQHSIISKKTWSLLNGKFFRNGSPAPLAQSEVVVSSCIENGIYHTAIIWQLWDAYSFV